MTRALPDTPTQSSVGVHRPRTGDTVNTMQARRLVIFDGDDTLWDVEPLYDAALDEAERLLHEAGLPAQRWRVLQREIDLRNVEALGLTVERFPRSSLDALDVLETETGHSVPPTVRDAIERTSRTVFERRAPVTPGADAALAALRPHFKLALLTKGDRDVQEKRIADSGLGHWFDHIEITPTKDIDSFRRVLTVFEEDPDESWSVGNSVVSDINPALRLGMRAIWIDAHVWEHERREELMESDNVVVLHKLQQVPGVLLAARTQSG